MVPAAKTHEVPNFGKKTVTVSGVDIILVNIRGKYYAVENECPHQGSPMTAAVVKDGYISCPRHGYRFSLETGTCAEHPEFTLKVFPAAVAGDDVLVELG